MKNRLFLLFLLIASLTAVSCKQRQESIGRIDAMLLNIDSLRSEYNAIDTASVRSAFSHFNVLIDSFNLYFDDRRDDSTFSILAEFSQLKGPFKYFSRHYGSLAEQLDYSTDQLKNLRDDAAGRKWKKEELNNYIESEELAIRHIAEDLATLTQNANSALEQYQRELPRMRNVIQAMRLHHEAPRSR
jgi:hypothetical protein